MDIKKTGLIKQIMGLAKKNSPVLDSNNKDSYKISTHGKLLAELDTYKKLVLSTPDVRQDRINDVKSKLESGFYSSKKVYDLVADKMAPFLKENNSN